MNEEIQIEEATYSLGSQKNSDRLIESVTDLEHCYVQERENNNNDNCKDINTITEHAFILGYN